MSVPASSHALNAGLPASLGYRLGALVYFFDRRGRVLLLQRRRPPNSGLWCAIGGKLEMETGESPFECAQREAREEAGVDLKCSDLALRSILAEKDYQGSGHWLMFVFRALVPVETVPDRHAEGGFRFFERSEIMASPMPTLDRALLLEHFWDKDAKDLYALRADAAAIEDPLALVIEERIGGVDDSADR